MKRTYCIAAIVAAFGLSRALFAAANPFAMNLAWWHYLDAGLLRTDLLRSLWYLHSQPPLLNAALGIALKLFPTSYPLAFRILFWVIGLAFQVALFLLLTELEVALWIALPIVLLFELSPATMMYESWFYNTYPTAALLSFAALFLLRYLRTSRPIYAVGCAGSMGSAILINSSFQIIWWIAILTALFFVMPRRQFRPLLKCTLPVMAIVLLVYLKNFALFGTLTTSSWLGMNLGRMTVDALSIDEREQLADQGVLSRVVLPLSPYRSATFEPVSDYRLKPSGATGIPALDDVWKKDNSANFNNIRYLEISRAFMRDDLWVIRHRPGLYLRQVRLACAAFVKPAGDYKYISDLRNNLGLWSAFYRPFFKPFSLPGKDLSIVLLLLVPGLMVYGTVIVVRGILADKIMSSRDVCLLFIVLTMIYASTVSLLFEVFENNRFRYAIDPYFLTLGCILLNQLAVAASSRLYLFTHYAVGRESEILIADGVADQQRGS